MHPVWSAPEANDQNLTRSESKALVLLKRHGLVAEWGLQESRGA
jgi:hypothetical protein